MLVRSSSLSCANARVAVRASSARAATETGGRARMEAFSSGKDYMRMIFIAKTYYFIPHWPWCQLHAPHIIGTRTPSAPQHPDAPRGCPMAYLPLKSVTLPQASERVFDGWLEQLGARLAAPDAD